MFILAVFAVALLTTLAVGIVTAVRVELKAAHVGLARMQELFLAQAGVDVARAILLYQDDAAYDAFTDPWGPDADRPLNEPQALGEGYYRVRVYDACGRIDVNHADYETLLRLTNDPELAEEIVRWREGQAYEEAYLSLPYPYQPRQGLFQTPGELLLVQGMTPELFFGTEQEPGLVDLISVEAISPNTDANGNWRTLARDFASAAVERPDFEQWFSEHHGELLEIADLEIWKRIFSYSPPNSSTGSYASLAQLAEVLESYGALAGLDYLTARPDRYLLGLVNVNTAAPEVLAALPGGSAELAKAIVERREAGPFVSLGEVAQLLVSQDQGAEVLAQMIDHVTTKSSSFIIESMGTVRDTASQPVGHSLWAYVRRIDGNVRVLQQFDKGEPLPPYEETIRLAARR